MWRRPPEIIRAGSDAVPAGDLIGATPLLSALFHDEPTIEAFNLMDLDYNGVGNHEFAEGLARLEHAAAAEKIPTPVIDYLDLLVLR